MLLANIDANSIMPLRDRLLVLLSFKAGLRAAEITKIKLDSLCDVRGRVGPFIPIFDDVGKGTRERQIPMHPEVKLAIGAFMKAYPGANSVAISARPFRYHSPRKAVTPEMIRQMTVNAVTLHFRTLMKAAGFTGASSHSGRRTFCTLLGRRANEYHNSLRDVQRLMGHARLETTERYLEPSMDDFNMVASL